MNELFSKEFLASIGVNLDDETYAALAQYSEDMLNARVVESVVELLDEEQLEQLQAMRGSSPDQIAAWLTRNVPELPAVIEDEINILLGDIAESSTDL